ncbi:hypothetical protein ACP4OV_023600 [Aristida adscensionis]
MAPPTNQNPSIEPDSTSEDGLELKEEKDFLVKRKRIKFSESIVQPQQGVQVSYTENKEPGVRPLEVPADKAPIDERFDSAMQITGTANGQNKGTAGNESARSRLPKICTARGWKEPLYDFEEQGPPHNKLFKCKVTVHVDTIVNTVMECSSDPKPRKQAAQEHAAQGALWYLAHCGHVN